MKYKLILTALLFTVFACGEQKKEQELLSDSKKLEMKKEMLAYIEMQNDTLKSQDVDDLKEISITDLQETNSHFTFRGLPINPRVLHQFIPWMSDSQPSIMSIDLVSANDGSNQFFLDELKKDDMGYFSTKFEDGNIGYKWYGKLKNDVHVVQCYESGGGSGVFSSLLFVKFEMRDFVNNGKPYKQLLINNLRHYSLKDRSSTDVKIDKQNNKVYVSTQAHLEKVSEKFVVEF